jgi:hypothetical protein
VGAGEIPVSSRRTVRTGQGPAFGFGDPLPAGRAAVGGARLIDPLDVDAGEFGLVGQDADGLARPVAVTFVGHMAVAHRSVGSPTAMRPARWATARAMTALVAATTAEVHAHGHRRVQVVSNLG